MEESLLNFTTTNGSLSDANFTTEQLTFVEEVDEPVLDQTVSSSLYDVKYVENKPLLIIQSACIFGLILLKYGAPLTRFRLKNMQVKLFGTLILTQSLMMHKRTNYSAIWADRDLKTILDAVVTLVLFVLSLLHLMRLNQYMPSSWMGEYQLIA